MKFRPKKFGLQKGVIKCATGASNKTFVNFPQNYNSLRKNNIHKTRIMARFYSTTVKIPYYRAINIEILVSPLAYLVQ